MNKNTVVFRLFVFALFLSQREASVEARGKTAVYSTGNEMGEEVLACVSQAIQMCGFSVILNTADKNRRQKLPRDPKSKQFPRLKARHGPDAVIVLSVLRECQRCQKGLTPSISL